MLFLPKPKEIKILEFGNTTIDILKYIAENSSISGYDYYKYLNKYRLKNKTIAYKGVHLKVYKLIQLCASYVLVIH